MTSKAPTITVPSGLTYTVAVADKLSTAATTTAWVVSGTNASLCSSMNVTYTVKNNKVVYTAKNVKTSSLALPVEKNLTLDAAVFGTKTTLKSNSGGYSLKLTGDMKNKTFVGTNGIDLLNIAATNAKVSAGGGNDSLVGGSGNDSLVGNAGNDKLYGQAGADTLVGGAGNDSLWGGSGNDSLYGGAGNDTFIYKPGEGTDKIFDYASGDTLTILKSNGNSGGSFTSSKYSGGDLTLSISDGGTVIFDNVSKNDKFNINGKTYTISGTKLK